MKYEIYKTLTNEQKEEWSFKYKDKPTSLPNILIYSIVLTTLLMSLFLVAYLISKENNVEVTMKVFGILDTASTFISGIVLIVIVDILYNVGMNIYLNIAESRWLKSIDKK